MHPVWQQVFDGRLFLSKSTNYIVVVDDKDLPSACQQDLD